MNRFRSGQYIQEGSYKSFHPEKIHRKWEISDMALLTLLSEADRQIGRLDMYSEYIPNIDLFISMHVAKEATQSSKIEGTRTGIEEAFMQKNDVHAEKRDDWEEVQNYILALNEAIASLDHLPFSSRLIKQAHQLLLSEVRGEHKQPGEFRKSQNWIGGASIKDAVFIPPSFAYVDELMSDLEKFAHDTEHPLPDLLKIGIIHYQFETIHPFLDGNGRIGRLMIILYLVEKGILKRPVLYLSDFFEKNRILYYDNLMRVRTHHDLIQWLKFFLVGVINTAKKGIETFDDIMKLQKESRDKISQLSNRQAPAFELLDFLFQQPLVNAQSVLAKVDLSLPTIYSLLEEFERLEILVESTGKKRNKQYVFQKYIGLFG